MSQSFSLVDLLAVADLQTYLSRAARVEEGSVRLIAGSGVLAVYTAIVPLAGVLILLFTVEQLVCGWQHRFEGPEDRDDSREAVE